MALGCGLSEDDGGALEVGGQGLEYLRLGLWLAMLLVGWALQKGLCAAGWPEDCAKDCDEQHAWTGSCAGLPWAWDRLGEAGGLQQLLIYGLFTGWLNGAGHAARFTYLFGPQRPPPRRHGTELSRDSFATTVLGPEPDPRDGLLTPINSSSAAMRAASYGLPWHQRFRLPWFPLLYLATIPVFSRLTMLGFMKRSLSAGIASAPGFAGCKRCLFFLRLPCA